MTHSATETEAPQPEGARFQKDGTQSRAAEYHCNDFTWESLRDRVLKERQESASCLRESDPFPIDTAAGQIDHDSAHLSNKGQGGDLGHSHHGADESNPWELFYGNHSGTPFFKPRRYITTAFPQLLLRQPPQHFVEIGAGTGATILQVLLENKSARATVWDLSQTALENLVATAGRQGIERERLSVSLTDASCPSACATDSLARGVADAVLLVFTLSAVEPWRMETVLRLAYDTLRPGGLLLFRDYAEFDLPMLRFEKSGKQQISDRFFRRQDGTLAYFFTLQDIQSRATSVGFDVIELKYACVNNRVYKSTLSEPTVLQRAFVHGVFSHPCSRAVLDST